MLIFNWMSWITRAALAGALITLSYMVWMTLEIRPLTAREIVSFELAGNSREAGTLLETLGPERRELMKKSLYLDFGFLLCYSLSLALSCRALPPLTGMKGWIMAGKYLSGFSLVAGLLDAIENVLLVHILNAGPTNLDAGIAAACASVKFFLVAVALLFILITLGMLIKKRKPG